MRGIKLLAFIWMILGGYLLAQSDSSVHTTIDVPHIKSYSSDTVKVTTTEFMFADTNNDGVLMLSEVREAIHNYFENKGGYNLKVITRLISYFNSKELYIIEPTSARTIIEQAKLDSLKKANGPNYSHENFSHRIDKYVQIGAQLTSAYQMQSRLSKALYSGPASLKNTKDEQTISLVTLSLLFNPWKNTDIVLSPEIEIGNGVGNGAGMAAYPMALFGSPQSTPYMLRGQVRQHFLFENKKRLVEYNFTVGRFVIQEMFDTNPYSEDPRVDFLNFNHNMLGAWDASTTAYGYTHGVGQSFIFKKGSLNMALCTVDTAAGNTVTDWNVTKAYSINMQGVRDFTVSNKLLKVRLLGYYNSYKGGDFNKVYYDSTDAAVKFDTNKRYVAKFGFGLDANYDWSDNVGLFARYSWSDGNNENFGYTQCDASANVGALFGLTKIKRKFDKLGIAASYNTISKKQQGFLKNGGSSFMLGDGNLNYAPEQVVEIFYNANFFHDFYITLNYQYAMNTAYNKDRGNAHFISVRVNVVF